MASRRPVLLRVKCRTGLILRGGHWQLMLRVPLGLGVHSGWWAGAASGLERLLAVDAGAFAGRGLPARACNPRILLCRTITSSRDCAEVTIVFSGQLGVGLVAGSGWSPRRGTGLGTGGEVCFVESGFDGGVAGFRAEGWLIVFVGGVWSPGGGA